MAKNSPVSTFIAQFAKAIVAAVTVILCSRFMGAAGRGELSLVLFYVNLIMIANEFVGGSSLAGMMVAFPGKRNLFASLVWSLVVLCLATLVVWLLPLTHAYFWAIICISIPLALITLLYSVFQAHSLVYERNRIQLGIEILKLAGIVGLYFFMAKNLMVNQVALVFSLSTGVFLLVAILLLLKFIRADFTAAQPAGSDLYKNGFLNQTGQLIQFFNYRLSLLIITHFLGLKDTGIFANTLLIADTIWIFGNSFGTIAHMRILRSENPRFRADITLRYAAIALAGTALACILLILLPNALFTAVFGSDFSALKNNALWFIPAILALGLSTVFSHYLHAINNFKWLIISNLSGLILQTALGYYLIPRMGLQGASLAANAGFILILILLLYRFKKSNTKAQVLGVFRLRQLRKIVMYIIK